MKKQILVLLSVTTLALAGDFVNSIGMKFKEIPSGSFMMGTQIPNCNAFTDPNQIEKCYYTVQLNESPAHRVTLKSFYMGETEVTQRQWYAVMGNNPSNFKTGDENMPVERVSWNDAKEFVKKLNAKEKTNKYRLPTEEEWEYAARAGTTTKWHCGDDESCVDSIAWYGKNSGKRTHPVKRKKPNKWGLYDMSGNVWEWTDSCYTKDYNSECEENHKVSRGGGWDDDADFTRSAYRSNRSPDIRYTYGQGFRVLRDK